MESCEELSKMSIAELKKTKAYYNCSISKPGFPKSKMKKLELLDLFKQDVKLRQHRKNQSVARPDERSTAQVPPVAIINQHYRNKIVTRLNEIAAAYALLNSPKFEAFQTAGNNITMTQKLTLELCKNLQGIGPSIYNEIELVLNDEDSPRLWNLLTSGEFKEIKQHFETLKKYIT
jgi:hypothetical protein